MGVGLGFGGFGVCCKTLFSVFVHGQNGKKKTLLNYYSIWFLNLYQNMIKKYKTVTIIQQASDGSFKFPGGTNHSTHIMSR